MSPKIYNNSPSLFLLVVYAFLHGVNGGNGVNQYSPPSETTVCLVVGSKTALNDAPNDGISHLLKFTAPFAFRYFINTRSNHFAGISGQLSQIVYNSRCRSFSHVLLQTRYKKNISHLSSEGDAEFPSFI